jgi:sec-independent protein translocase protein TatA
MLLKLQSAISLFTCGCLVSVAASPSSIGFVVTSGTVQVDGAAVRGNSTLFQGNVVRAGDATSDLMFRGGSNLLLQPGSTVTVFREYGVLEHGAAVQRGPHALVADGLQISSLSPQGAVFVDVQDKSHLKVTAQGGVAEVRNPAGLLVARLEPGKALSFAVQVSQQNSTPTPPPQNSTPTAGQAPPPAGMQLTLHGILRKDHPGRYGHFLLTDMATNVTYELQGPGLDDLVGASVEVTGSTYDTAAAEGASKVMSVSDIHQMPLSEIRGETTPANPAPGAPAGNTPPAAPPTPSGDTVPAPGAGPEVGATPEATAPPEPTTPNTPPPLPQHSDTTKILVIVGIAAGAVVGVALGLGGGKSSTVSPE